MPLTPSQLVPHGGDMCLLEEVISWNPQRVLCSTHSHCSPQNPLRCDEQLSAIHAVEYGAQAVAVHGGLLACESGEAIKPGYLVALRQIKLHQSRLDTITSALTVEAIQLLSDAGNLMYSFSVSAEDQMIADGRVMVMVQPEKQS